MKIPHFGLIAVFASLYCIVFVILFIRLIKRRKELTALQHSVNFKMSSCKILISHYIGFIKHFYDLLILWQSNPALLCKKMQTMFLNNSEFINSLKKDSIAMVNICNSDIITHFAENFPELSKSDLEFCSLICLGFPSHTMQTLYELNNSTSYYNRRKRLRTKLHIGTNANLETFINDKIKEIEKAETTVIV